MTFAASVALLSCGIAVYVAALAGKLSRAPGWNDLRYFSFAALTGGVYAALNIPTSAPIASDATVVVFSRLQLAAAALHSIAWTRYSIVLLGRQRSRIDRALVPALWGVAVLAVTPWALPGGLRIHHFAPLGITYRTADPTTLGTVAYALALTSLLLPITRLAAAWRRGVPNAGVQLLSLAALLVMGLNDTLVVEGAYAAPYLLDVGFLMPAAAVGYALTARFVEDARAHQALRAGLERQVQERTAELGRAQEALHRAEKLAALGQFAAGVAHEVNNPAAVVSANLHYLAETERDALGGPAQDAVSESLVAMQRIGAIVRQLLDAGRLAASPEALGSVSPRALGDAAISAARARFGKRVLVLNLLPDRQWVRAQEGVLAQVLVNLVVNAVQAIPDRRTDGKVVIRSEQVAADRVRLVVEDNGSGMEPEVLRRVFEPFFTTKPFGSGTGLGLAVSRGLVIGLGGDLRLESEPGVGTRAIVELEPAPPPPAREARAADGAAPRLHLLLVDDEPTVLTSLRRLLESRYGVDLAKGVDDGLERLQATPYDVVLCDVMMPAGGGERLYRTLVRSDPAVARRVVFFTGGAVTDAARQFLRNQPQPVLTKPLDLDQLARVAEQIATTTPGGR